MMGSLGPSFADGRRFFEEVFGDERNVLVRLQDWILEQGFYTSAQLQEKWIELKRAH